MRKHGFITGIIVIAVIIGIVAVVVRSLQSGGDSVYGFELAGNSHGDAIVVFENDDGIRVQKYNSAGKKTWGQEGIFLGEGYEDHDTHYFLELSTDDGGLVLAWPDTSSGQLKPGDHLSRLDMNAISIWQREFIDIAEMVGDGSGGVILIFHDAGIFPVSADETETLALVRVGAAGEYPWGIQGVAVPCGDDAYYPVVDGDGGIIVVWEKKERPAELAVGEPGMIHRLYAQRISSDGSKPWGDGVLLFTSPENVQIDSVQVTGDGQGGAILAWFHVTEDRSQEPGHQQTWDIALQRIDASGNVCWQDSGVPCEITRADPAAHPMAPVLAGDGSSGAVVAWRDTRHEDGSEASVYAQRINADGVPLWPAGGVPVSATSLNPHPSIVNCGNGELVIAYSFPEDGKGLYLQKLDGDGNRAWQENGISVTEGSFTKPVIVADGEGGAVIGWMKGKKGYIQQIAADGSRPWGEEGILIE